MTPDALRPLYDGLSRGEWSKVRARCRQMLRHGADLAVLHHAIGLSFCGEAQFAKALPHFAAAVRIEPGSPRWARDLGVVYAKLARWADAADVLAPVLDSLDGDALALFLTAAGEVSRHAAALALLAERRRGPLPTAPQFLCAYGVTLAMVKRYGEATAILMDCLARDPESADAHEALAFVYDATNEPELALHHARQLARLQPASAHAAIRLALTCSERGLIDESRALRREAIARCITRPEDHSAKLFMMLSDPQASADGICTAARESFGDERGTPLPRPRSRRRAVHRRIRVGYVSGECRSTPAYYFFRPFLPRHDRGSIEVFLYCCNTLRDHVTPAYQAWPEHWRDCAHVSDRALVDAIRADAIDVVVDLSGHFIFNRLTALAARAAPVQATYPNFPGTTGCPAIDYFFTDIWTSPPGSDGEYSERLHRLRCGYLMYEPPDAGPPVAPLPMRKGAGPTFGVFQRLSKINDAFWNAIVAVLERVPRSRLLIQNGDRELDRPESLTARRLRRELEERGIDPERMTLKGPLPYMDHLAAVTNVDVALDTFPYNGQTTTCESLWMGVPVVTMPQGTHVSRVCAALLTRIGHADWVAHSPGAYASIAASLVSDAGALAGIRRRLRRDVLDGGLADGPALARALEAAYHSFCR